MQWCLPSRRQHAGTLLERELAKGSNNPAQRIASNDPEIIRQAIALRV